MKCNERCLELRLGDTCGRCGGLVDVKKPLITVTPGPIRWGPWASSDELAAQPEIEKRRRELLEVSTSDSPFAGGRWNNPGRSGDAHGFTKWRAEDGTMTYGYTPAPSEEVTEHRSEDGSMVFRRLNRPVPVDGLENQREVRRRELETIPLAVIAELRRLQGAGGLSPSQRLMLGEAAAERYLRHFARQYGPLDAAHREKVRRHFEAAEIEGDAMRRMPSYFVRADGELLVDELSTRTIPPGWVSAEGELLDRPERCCGMVDAHGRPGCSHCPISRGMVEARPIGTGPRSTDEACSELGRLDGVYGCAVFADEEAAEWASIENNMVQARPSLTVRSVREYIEEAKADLEADLGAELAHANFQLAHDVVASMSDGPAPRAADDADEIQKAMREIHLAEGRRPLSCAPGQHNFQFSAGTYTCTVCLRGKPEDGR